ncbi:hypothetical protein BH747_02005 [Enterococcus villorum]|uniref:Uncharacterized protein n=1 Tax=Enterococcus villorum TaxID=112904 RepID=A0A1V8YUA9_9ENTE|nr:hypothetical protein [Enterococcus villorum]OQO71627.1 hypothetical protein BH747_02005 [Enterococcus villorum]OQO76191.1 hypothetical protein BH744_04410 [Enterococcus villorum]
MNTIQLFSSNQILAEAEELRNKFDNKIRQFPTEITWDNTENSLVKIVHGGIDYFSSLNTIFLGEGNTYDIPDAEADHFANNIFRLVNAIDYLAELRKFKLKKSNELNILLDIRTLIVHSGEQVVNLKSLELVGYKDSQLGRIFKRVGINSLRFMREFSDMDYCITVWNDKHDKTQKYHLSEVDYNRKNENYKDVIIYLKVKDVRNIVLEYIEDFINYDIVPRKKKRGKNDISKKEMFSENAIDFKTIARIISKDLRGGYLKENEVDYWDGFGLQKLFEYVQKKVDIHEETRILIIDKIKNIMSNYWNVYQKGKTTADNLPNLDISEIFKEYTPYYELKDYIEGKLFEHIAPNFNTSGSDSTDVDFLFEFFYEVNNVLSKPLSLEQDVDDLICDYFVQSVQESISRNKLVVNGGDLKKGNEQTEIG